MNNGMNLEDLDDGGPHMPLNRRFLVLYRDEKIMAPADPPFGFSCVADDGDHAEEQCLNAYPGVDVVWVHRCHSLLPTVPVSEVEEALADYWDVQENP